MYALVDWDNLDDRDCRAGAKYVADKLWLSISTIAPQIVSGVQSLDLRLYGGWNGRHQPTARASHLEVDLQQNFPFFLRDPNRQTPVKVTGELAQSLVRLPRHILQHTFRQRQGPPKLHCQTATQLACIRQGCPISTVHDLFNQARCPEQTCSITLEQVLTRSEQKLVDTMLVADLIHFAMAGHSPLAVVSSDDDLWPGILMALDAGSNLLHVRPKNHSSHRIYMNSALQRSYFQGGL